MGTEEIMIHLGQNDRNNNNNSVTMMTTTTLCCIVVTLFIRTILHRYFHRRKDDKTSTYNDNNNNNNNIIRAIPDAKGAVPILGHALEYKKDPSLFLWKQQQILGSDVFRINLAGQKMIVIGGSDKQLLKQIANQPKSILNQHKAVAQVGFEYTLGPLNVYQGTDIQKRLLHDEILNPLKFETVFLPQMFQTLRHCLQTEISYYHDHHNHDDNNNNSGDKKNTTTVVIPDLFQFIRRIMLRSVLDYYIGPCLLIHDEDKDPTATKQPQKNNNKKNKNKNKNDLVSMLMAFQDSVEDATAKAAILPPWISLPLVLWPMKYITRRRVEQKLTRLIQKIWEKYDNYYHYNPEEEKRHLRLGPWLRHWFSSWKQQQQQQKQEKQQQQQPTTPEEVAQLIIGFMFAAHKNVAIGTSQSFCFLQETFQNTADTTAKENIQKEANQLCQHFWNAAAAATTTNATIDDNNTNNNDAKMADDIDNNHNTNNVSNLLQAEQLRSVILETLRITAHSIGAIRYVNKSFPIHVHKHNNNENDNITFGKKEENPNNDNNSNSNKDISNDKNINNNNGINDYCHIIPEGEIISICHTPIHYNEQLWGPKAFQFQCNRPEWCDNESKHNNSDENNENNNGKDKNNTNTIKSLGVPVDPYKFTTFSHGVHKCPGEKLALCKIELLLALLLEHGASPMETTSSTTSTKIPPLCWERATLAQRKNKIPITIQQPPS